MLSYRVDMNQKEEMETCLQATQVFLETHWIVDLDLSWPQTNLEKEGQDLLVYLWENRLI